MGLRPWIPPSNVYIRFNVGPSVARDAFTQRGPRTAPHEYAHAASRMRGPHETFAESLFNPYGQGEIAGDRTGGACDLPRVPGARYGSERAKPAFGPSSESAENPGGYGTRLPAPSSAWSTRVNAAAHTHSSCGIAVRRTMPGGINAASLHTGGSQHSFASSWSILTVTSALLPRTAT